MNTSTTALSRRQPTHPKPRKRGDFMVAAFMVLGVAYALCFVAGVTLVALDLKRAPKTSPHSIFAAAQR